MICSKHPPVKFTVTDPQLIYELRRLAAANNVNEDVLVQSMLKDAIGMITPETISDCVAQAELILKKELADLNKRRFNL